MSTPEPKPETRDTQTHAAVPGVSANELLELITQGHDTSDLSTLIEESLLRRAAA